MSTVMIDDAMAEANPDQSEGGSEEDDDEKRRMRLVERTIECQRVVWRWNGRQHQRTYPWTDNASPSESRSDRKQDDSLDSYD